VPVSESIKLDSAGNLIRQDTLHLNPPDEFSLEEALKIKDRNPAAKIIALTMGPPQAEEILRYAIAKGADVGYLLSDPILKGSDTLATSYALSNAIRTISGETTIDLIFCSVSSYDSGTGHIPGQLSEILKMKGVFFVTKIEEVAENVVATRKTCGREEKIRFTTPALLSIEKNINTPRLPSIRGKLKSKKAVIKLLSAKDAACDSSRVGINSQTKVIAWFKSPAPGKTMGKEIAGQNATEKCEKLVNIIMEAIKP